MGDGPKSEVVPAVGFWHTGPCKTAVAVRHREQGLLLGSGPRYPSRLPPGLGWPSKFPTTGLPPWVQSSCWSTYLSRLLPAQATVHNADLTYSAGNTRQKVCPAENGEYLSSTRGWSSNFGLPCDTCHSHAYRRMQKGELNQSKGA